MREGQSHISMIHTRPKAPRKRVTNDVDNAMYSYSQVDAFQQVVAASLTRSTSRKHDEMIFARPCAENPPQL